LELLEVKGKSSYTWYIPHFIVNANSKVVALWLRAFFVDEATVTKTGIVRIKSMNYTGLKQIKRLLRKFKIESTLTGPNCDKPYYLGIIYKRYNYLFQKYKGLTIIKREKN